jgi:uncharacterized protein YgfB (UPF0149 family)
MLKAPTSPDFPTFDAMDQALRRVEAPADAAEVHGTLCGLVCGLGPGGQSVWLADTLAEAPADRPVPAQTGDLLAALAAGTCATLEAGELNFQPLLPDDDQALAERVDSLAQWCLGFNHGLFVAARIGDAEAELNGGNTAEIVRDFSEMSLAAVANDEPDAAGEEAFVELVEYVRVSVQLVYEELAAVRQRVLSAGTH